MPDEDAKRAGMLKFRLLVIERARQHVTAKLGDVTEWRKLENESMKLVRDLWNAQSGEIQQRLTQGDDIDLDDLLPDPKNPHLLDHSPASAAEDVVAAGAVEIDAGAPDEPAVMNEDASLDGMLAHCVARPVKAERERGVKKFILERRSELVTQLQAEDWFNELDFRSKDDAIRKLGRAEFNKLSSDEQWQYALTERNNARSRGGAGRFVAAMNSVNADGVGDGPAPPAADVDPEVVEAADSVKPRGLLP